MNWRFFLIEKQHETVDGRTAQLRLLVEIPVYGCKSKCEVRINPQNPQAIQTPEPDLRSRPIQTSRSRPIQTWRSRPMIQTFSKYWKVLLCTTKYYSSTTLYYKVLLCTTKYDAGWSREFWKNLAIPFQTSFQTVPDPFQTSSMESKGSVHSQPCCQADKTGLCVQCRIIWFSLSRIWNDYHDSRHSVPDVRKRHFTKVVVPDVRIIAERSRPVYRPIAIYLQGFIPLYRMT